jgi:phage shock protein C
MTEQQAPQQPNHQPPPPPQGSFRAPYRRLTRTSWDAPISGVCGGVARYLGVDPTLVRVLAAITMVVTFPAGPIVYAVMWAVMPKE